MVTFHSFENLVYESFCENLSKQILCPVVATISALTLFDIPIIANAIIKINSLTLIFLKKNILYILHKKSKKILTRAGGEYICFTNTVGTPLKIHKKIKGGKKRLTVG